MAITPAQPYPKQTGHPIRSADWNQLVDEVVRLDNAKLNGSGGAITGNLSVSGILSVGPFALATGPGGIEAVGSAAELGFAKRTLAAWPANPAPGDRYVWYNPDGTARLWTEDLGDLLTVNSDGGIGIRTDDIGTYRLVIQQAASIEDRGLRVVNQAGDKSAQVWVGTGGAVLDAEGTTNLHLRTGGVDRIFINNSTGDININAQSRMSFGNQVRQMLNLWSTGYGIGVQSGTLYFRTDQNFAWHLGGTHNDAATNPGSGGRRLMALNSAGDFILSGRTNPDADPNKSLCRALVDLTNQLWINFGNDFNQGLFTGGNLTVAGNAFKPGGGSWFATSDRALKKNVRQAKGALDKLLQLRGVSFEWKEPEKQGNQPGQQFGFVAQEVEQVFPDWVVETPDGMKAVGVRGFEALSVEAFRELSAENEKLRKRVDDLEKRLKTLEKKAGGTQG